MDSTFQAIEQKLGPVSVLLYNSGGGVFKNVEEANWRINVQGLVAATKAAQRSLAQSLARQVGPERIHVANVLTDGVMDLPRTREWLHDKPDDFFVKPSAAVDAIWTLCHQDPSAWTSRLWMSPVVGRCLMPVAGPGDRYTARMQEAALINTGIQLGIVHNNASIDPPINIFGLQVFQFIRKI